MSVPAATHNCCRQQPLPLPLLQVQTRLEVEVRGGKALRLPIHGDAVLPAVDIKEAELAFGDVYTGVTVKHSLTVINTSPVPASEFRNEVDVAEGRACLCACGHALHNQAHALVKQCQMLGPVLMLTSSKLSSRCKHIIALQALAAPLPPRAAVPCFLQASTLTCRCVPSSAWSCPRRTGPQMCTMSAPCCAWDGVGLLAAAAPAGA